MVSSWQGGAAVVLCMGDHGLHTLVLIVVANGAVLVLSRRVTRPSLALVLARFPAVAVKGSTS